MMDMPEDDVGIELMNAKFREMGILVADEDGYTVAPAFMKKLQAAVAKASDETDVESPAYRDAVIAQLPGLGVPEGFEPIVANWIIHALRSVDW